MYIYIYRFLALEDSIQVVGVSSLSFVQCIQVDITENGPPPPLLDITNPSNHFIENIRTISLSLYHSSWLASGFSKDWLHLETYLTPCHNLSGELGLFIFGSPWDGTRQTWGMSGYDIRNMLENCKEVMHVSINNNIEMHWIPYQKNMAH